MHMRRCQVAGIIDGNGTAQRRRHLQAAGKAGIGEEELLPIGEFDRRNIGGAGNVGDAVEIR